MQGKIIITLPHPSFHGGVGNIFRVLKLNEANKVEYFFNTQENRSANPKFFVYMLCKFIKHIRNKKVVHLNPSLDPKAIIRDGFLLIIAKVFNKKVVVFMHGWDDNFEKKIQRDFIYKVLFSYAFNKVDNFILLGEIFKEKLESLNVKGRPCYFLPTIADDQYLESTPAASDFTPTTPVRLLFIAGFVPSKGIDIVLNTLLILNKGLSVWKFELTMAGDGPELEKWKSYAKDHDLTNVKFTGYVSGLLKHQCFKDADILFYPSYSEGVPCAIMEAMLYGLVIVTRPIGGIPYWVKHLENGWLSSSTDPEVFAKGILTLLDQPDLMRRIKKNNHKVAVNNFTPGKVRERLVHIYDNLSR